MPYCTINDVKGVLPENINIGDMNIGTPQPGRATKRSTVTPQEVYKYILYAQEYIDGKLRNMYICPLRRIKTFETDILTDANAGTDVHVTVNDSNYFIEGDIVRLQSKSVMELSEVKTIDSATVIVLTSLTSNYSAADGSKISQLRYPDPIPIITARFACSYILDRLFIAEQSPDVSKYGVAQRNMATNQMDSISLGETLLFGQEHSGRRFVRGSLFDAYKSPADIQKGQEKE